MNGKRGKLHRNMGKTNPALSLAAQQVHGKKFAPPKS
jgi:hypothetical protein